MKDAAYPEAGGGLAGNSMITAHGFHARIATEKGCPARSGDSGGVSP